MLFVNIIVLVGYLLIFLSINSCDQVVDPSRDWIILVHTLDNDVLSIARKNIPDINKSEEAKLLAKEFCSTIVQILEQSPHYRVLISMLLPKFDSGSKVNIKYLFQSTY